MIKLLRKLFGFNKKSVSEYTADLRPNARDYNDWLTEAEADEMVKGSSWD